MRLRVCQTCGFENAEAGRGCPLCGAPAVDELEVIDNAPPPEPEAPEPARETTTAREPHSCAKCGQPFVVTYETVPGEQRRAMPVACPHCWQMNQAPVGHWAAAGEEYRVEKG
jgi:DNA-directed RNA polymerase subunit RPC12/RpoP